ncbi:HAD family hydrolase [Janthinobacterium sp. 17J80-10]|uniref:histidinol-phosphatase n=1 Tax=Janthinobacterium sp. 17J80-10 TaxID=2497863 RepID=UPI00100528CB|nr:HAD family hydrolase [Janthinobacterium sp. 17J80-10]QAU33615.1 HAD family hydrolase [Janthinobacterium sp. 17J80-10]
MTNLALFDLDHTLLPLDSDFEWGQFLARTGAVDANALEKRNAAFYQQYQAGTLDPVAYLEFVFGILAQFPRPQLDAWHQEFMAEVITPSIRQAARELVQKHQEAGDLVAIITATNRFVTGPIARAFGVEHLIAAEPELAANGDLTGRLVGTPPYGAGKVVNAQAWLASLGHTLDGFERSHFYSDSQNDIPLLSLVTNPVATNPNALLAAHAQAHGWPTLQLFHD